ncbi:YHS domain-containing (seleno)protein [Nisaea nitritireducens]|uniref:YHS domain-containing (seleno)protein n=1 Tax=Nisaea nitritireducens TaxID=568392 RepID=UPI0018681D07|nr:YHS domain-containing (seleno)protein [Nisaea nitritireducens]
MSCKRGLSRLFLVLVAVGLAAAVSRDPTDATEMKMVDPTISAHQGLAIGGYDPVAYFTDYAAVHGDKAHAVDYDGVRFLFANADNRAQFLQDPKRYLPQFGGYSTFALSKGKLYGADPTVFDIIDGRLYLSRNERVQELWHRNPDGYIRQAEENWSELSDR